MEPCFGCGCNAPMTRSKYSNGYFCWICGMIWKSKIPTMKEFYEWFIVELNKQSYYSIR